ncbi:PTS cellobiose transporter subunit IIC [Streptococcus pneumoniae]|uniref:PTS cellobiose transporter subunit IIC n=1 Tax=Streptococcus pneumoniae TaxID=1313 RepID=UPI0005E761F6|nr:PTS cellobiose transporter subunit IIC [Streptococcus pneumoniae]MBW5099191.1 PTS cellobiose transporter subunit IIC [Streptococcus pneumoniae]MDG7191485.1 PTS cellobiose transporter subunit IIC [Streptococcus pneumoniae]MDG7648107.1 PTS cellobiose transporter subunit IIC [Streptococcus pneumoniae]MDG9114554.1 PTS cellobiose transporter subunit IIC [Streptococcus pneumoniae]MDG9357844.1 PTS cellobiose transporter subunit IIC [Streptococcus pneumoniae]
MDQQNGLFGFLENHVMGPMGKLAQFKVVRAITAAGMAAVPFTIVGSMFLVFSILPQAFSFWPIVADIFSASFDKFTSLYMVANYATMGSLSLYFVLSLAYELTKIYAEEEELNMNPLNGALMAFVMTVPQIIFDGGMMKTVTSLKEGAVIADGWAMGNGVARFGTTGIFTAIIMAIVTVLIYRMCVKHNWVIKMPEAVPEGVSRGFTALVPGFVVAFVVIFINGLLVAMGTDIFKVIAIPFGFVSNLTNSWIGLMIIYLLTQLLWIVGIHGANIVFAFVSPIALANMAENAAGGHFAVAGEFSNMFVIAGGSGATLGLCLYIAFASKSEQLKAIGRASVVPALFNINEPLIFGLPIIYNPALAIPFILAPMVTATIYYVANSLNFIKPIIAQVPWPTPVGIGAFLGTADLRAVLVALVCAFAAFLVYLPFIRVYDQKLVKEEQGI